MSTRQDLSSTFNVSQAGRTDAKIVAPDQGQWKLQVEPNQTFRRAPGPTSSAEPGISFITTTLGKRTTKHQTNKTPIRGSGGSLAAYHVALGSSCFPHLGFFLNWRPLMSSANLALASTPFRGGKKEIENSCTVWHFSSPAP
jgi:hypothetical protein